MNRPARGFTIVELLIVIVVIGILLGIAVVSMSGYTRWANNEARMVDIKTWASTFDNYKGRLYVWPTMPANNADPKAVCLGAFVNDVSKPAVNTNGRCAKYPGTTAYPAASATYINATGADVTELNDQVKRIGDIPQNGGKKTNEGAGPFVYVWQQTASGTTTVTGAFVNYFEGSCPDDLVTVSTLISGPNSARYAGLSSLTSGTTACALEKTFSFTP